MTTAQATIASAAPTRVRYRVLAFVCGLSMITYLDRVCFGNAAPMLAAELGLAGGTASLKWAFTSFAIAYGLFEIPSGWFGDRWGPRGVLIRIVGWWSACTILTGLIGMNVWGVTLGGLGALIVLRFLFGAGEAGAYPNITRTIHNWFPTQQWEFAQGSVWLTARLMGGLTPLVWTLLVGRGSENIGPLSWRGAFLLFGLLGFAWCAAFAIWFRNRPEEHPKVNDEERRLIGSAGHAASSHGNVPWLALLRNGSLRALCAMYLLVTFVWIFNITYLPSYLAERFPYADGYELLPEFAYGFLSIRDDILVAIYTGAPLWVGAIGCLMGGSVVSAISRRLDDRRRARRWLGMTAMSLCACFWIGAIFAPNIHLFCILISAAAFCIDLTMGSIWATCQDLGRRHAAVTAATMNMVGTFGAAFAGWFTGSLIERAVASRAAAMGISSELLTQQAQADSAMQTARHEAVLDGYGLVFLCNVAAFVIAAICWRLIDPTRSIEAGEPGEH